MRNPRHTLPVARDLKRDGADSASAVRAYYESNTRLFLSLGIGGKTLALRRAVWADGVASLPQAVDYVNTLVAADALSCPAGRNGGALRVLDIGCGVGGSLGFLCGAAGAALQGVGVTISPRQAEIARRQARKRGFSGQLSFLSAEFTAVSGLPLFHCAFAIESFVHFATPAAFFAAAARSVVPGGRVIVVDDFLAENRLSRREGRLVRAFRRGWVLSALCPVSRAAQASAGCGLRLVEDRNLSARLAMLPMSFGVISLLALLVHAVPLPWSYWRSTGGSLALAACQKARLVEYHYLVFEKPEA